MADEQVKRTGKFLLGEQGREKLQSCRAEEVPQIRSNTRDTVA